MSFLSDNPKVEEAKRLAREKIAENIENRRESLSNSAKQSKKRFSLVSSTPIRSKPKINKLIASAPPKSNIYKEKTRSDSFDMLDEVPSIINEDITSDDISSLEEEKDKTTETLSQKDASEDELTEDIENKSTDNDNDDNNENEDYVPESEEEDDDSIFSELEEISPEEVYELKKDAYIYKQYDLIFLIYLYRVVGENVPLDKQFLMYASIISSIIIVLCIIWMHFVK